MSKTRYILYSIGLGFLLSVFNIIIAIATFSAEDSLAFRIFFWNFYIAAYLVEKGLLPMCADCELITVFYSLLDGFIVGFVGYSIIVFGFIWLFNHLRKQKQIDVK